MVFDPCVEIESNIVYTNARVGYGVVKKDIANIFDNPGASADNPAIGSVRIGQEFYLTAMDQWWTGVTWFKIHALDPFLGPMADGKWIKASDLELRFYETVSEDFTTRSSARSLQTAGHPTSFCDAGIADSSETQLVMNESPSSIQAAGINDLFECTRIVQCGPITEIPANESTSIGSIFSCDNLDFSWLGKIGCWIHSQGVTDSLAYSDEVDYFVCTKELMCDVTTRCGGRPILLATDGYVGYQVIRTIETHAEIIAGVVWDYELRLETETILEVKEACNALGFPLGISVSTSIENKACLRHQNFLLSDAKQYCDFAVPKFYSQLLKNSPTALKAQYDTFLRVCPVNPVIPIIAISVPTTTPAIKKFNPLNAEKIRAIYYPMNIPRVIWMNDINTYQSQWDAIKEIPDGA